MNNKNEIKLFEDKRIRSLWNEAEEEWYFLRKRDILLGDYIGTNCPQVAMLTVKWSNLTTLKYRNNN